MCGLNHTINAMIPSTHTMAISTRFKSMHRLFPWLWTDQTPDKRTGRRGSVIGGSVVGPRDQTQVADTIPQLR